MCCKIAGEIERGRPEKEREREKDGTASNYFVAVREQSPNFAGIIAREGWRGGRIANFPSCWRAAALE